ncbi:MAG: tetratricopeptide repeat protein [Phycisphaerae bacterium]
MHQRPYWLGTAAWVTAAWVTAAWVTAAGLAVGGCAAGGGQSAAPSVVPPAPAGVTQYVAGFQALQAGQPEQAEANLKQAVEINPDLRMARKLLGEIYRDRGDYTAALPHFEALTVLDPYSALNFYKLGVSYHVLQRLAESRRAYERSLELDPAAAPTQMNLGLVMLAEGDAQAAVERLTRAVELDPQNPDAWSNLGVALDVSGNLQSAETAYRRSLELAPDRLATLQNLGSNLIGQGRGIEASLILQRVVEASPSPVAYKRLGDALVAGERPEQAMQAYTTAIQRAPRYLPAINALADLHIGLYTRGLELEESHRRRAVELWRQSLAVNPNQPRVGAQLEKWSNPSLFN